MQDLVSVILLKTIKILLPNSRFNNGCYERAQGRVNIIEKLEDAGRTDRNDMDLPAKP